MRVSLLTVLADDLGVVVLILAKEPLRIVVRIDVDLGQSIVRRLILHPLVHAILQPAREQLQTEMEVVIISKGQACPVTAIISPIPLLDLLHQLVDIELGWSVLDETSDDVLAAVHSEKRAHNDRETFGVDLAHVDLDRLLLIVAMEMEDEIADHVVLVADDDEWQLKPCRNLFLAP